jgi:hypothetical protein
VNNLNIFIIKLIVFINFKTNLFVIFNQKITIILKYFVKLTNGEAINEKKFKIKL